MKSNSIIYTVLLYAALLFISCNNSPAPDPAITWYEETKAEILKQADLEPDSVVTFKNTIAKRETLMNGKIIVPETTLVVEKAYLDGRIFHVRILSEEKPRAETFYSINGAFELRRELYPNGNYLFEGIIYNDHFYGLSTWSHANGKTEKQGVRFNDQRIGVWKKWDEAGILTEETDYQNLAKLDSLPQLMKQGHAQ